MAVIMLWKYAGRVYSIIQMVPNIIIPYVKCHKYHASHYVSLYVKTSF